jgi:beta-lactamase class A
MLWAVGGPERVRGVLANRSIEGVRFGPGERLLQSEVAGLAWRPELAIAGNFELARSRLPIAEREAALERYLGDPMDGAQPAGIARALARLAAGELLSPEATGVMLEIMAHSRSGPMRLKGGVAPGWQVFHKTGTGQELRGLATGYNDVAAMRAPDGTIYGVAVMIGQTRRPVPERMAMMQAVSRALIRFHESGPQS